MTDPEIHGYAWMWYGDEWRIEQDLNYRDLPLMPRERAAAVPTHTLDERRELKIAEGDCPMPGCYARLDADYYCSGCGNVSLPAAVEAESGVSSGETQVQPELPVDEYSPAQVEAA